MKRWRVSNRTFSRTARRTKRINTGLIGSRGGIRL